MNKEEEKALREHWQVKLRELWDLLEKVTENLISYETEANGTSIFDFQDKFEELFSEELND